MDEKPDISTTEIEAAEDYTWYDYENLSLDAITTMGGVIANLSDVDHLSDGENGPKVAQIREYAIGIMHYELSKMYASRLHEKGELKESIKVMRASYNNLNEK